MSPACWPGVYAEAHASPKDANKSPSGWTRREGRPSPACIGAMIQNPQTKIRRKESKSIRSLYFPVCHIAPVSSELLFPKEVEAYNPVFIPCCHCGKAARECPLHLDNLRGCLCNVGGVREHNGGRYLLL